ncbi:MAG: zinc metalloprotease HtpX [Candidatus Diapherotrites archaeon]
MNENLTKLNISIFLTTALVFGAIAALLGLVLLVSGATGGEAILLWIFISFFFIFIQWFFGPAIIKLFTRARKAGEQEFPELHEMVARLSKTAGIPKPTLYIVENRNPNAFAFGRTQKSAGIAVHTGLLQVLNKEELEGVIAHEIGHIKHRDVTVMTIASSLPVLLYFLVVLFAPRDRNKGLAGMLAVIVGGIIARLIGQLLVMWLSRRREYYADAFAAHATKKPLNLMSALAKITYRIEPKNENEGLKSLYIANPSFAEKQSIAEISEALAKGNKQAIEEAIEREKKHGALELFMTHPLTAKRLEALWKIKKEAY